MTESTETIADIDAAHRAFYEKGMGHEMPSNIEIDPRHDKALRAALAAVEPLLRERIARAIEAEHLTDDTGTREDEAYDDAIALAAQIARAE